MSVPSRWNEAPEDYIIDPLVSLLKRTRRWSRDGRSLRALNRHWWAAMNRHVVEVKPHWTRQLDWEDMKSLLKFPNLTALETKEFELYNSCSGSKCGYLAEIISHLPHLTHLDVEDFFFDLEEEDLVKLTGITKLSSPSLFYSQPLSKILYLPIEEVSMSFYFEEDGLLDWISKIPSLKMLHVRNARFSSFEKIREFVSSAKELETISIGDAFIDLGEFLPQLTNLVSINFRGSIECLSDFSRLTHLIWWFNNPQDLNTGTFRELVKRLKSLHLNYYKESDGCPIPDDLFAGSTSLNSLQLRRCILREDLIKDLPSRHLTHLSLNCCKTPGPLTFLGKFTTLRTLDITHNNDSKLTFEMQLTHLSFLQDLRLTADQCLRNAELMREISALSHLNSLTIWDDACYDDNIRLADAFEALENLHDLASLCIYASMSETAVKDFFNLKILTSLESIHVDFGLQEEEGKYFTTHLSHMAPHLQLDLYEIPHIF